ncbi:MAG TPA: type II toxin-antitoxin system HicB family antitoxin [Solirubrobacteraceae bacterium]|jgi:predicted RNase H-like HicB family nuclease|nr:type II toxin-antitoxin system HicB family antitoxin [Solirubrobacteraceae bacterium]
MIDIDSYRIHVERGPANCSAFSPDVQGCVATGSTVDECIAEMRSALEFHFEGMRMYGEPIPEPSGPGVYVEPEAAA